MVENRPLHVSLPLPNQNSSWVNLLDPAHAWQCNGSSLYAKKNHGVEGNIGGLLGMHAWGHCYLFFFCIPVIDSLRNPRGALFLGPKPNPPIFFRKPTHSPYNLKWVKTFGFVRVGVAWGCVAVVSIIHGIGETKEYSKCAQSAWNETKGVTE